MMMNNTLEEKKESILTNEIVKEEWMETKKYEEMTDDEKFKFDDYKARKMKFDEEAAKLRKKLEQDLNKQKERIEDICANFDNKLFILFTKRLEYQYRIYEQESYIIKLMQSIQSEKNYKAAMKADDERLKQAKEENAVNNTYAAALANTKDDRIKEVNDLEQNIRVLVKSNRHDIQNFYDNFAKKLDNERKYIDEYMEDQFNKFKDRQPHLTKRTNELDLFYEVENDQLKRQGVFDLDALKPSIDEADQAKRHGDGQSYFEKFKGAIEREILKRKYRAELAKMDNLITEAHQQEHILAKICNRIETDRMRHELLEDQEKNDIYIEFRFLKRMVEVPFQLTFLALEDAILIEGQIIHDLNKDILKEGTKRVEELEQNLKSKNNVEEIKFNVLEKELEIEDLVLESMAITRLKVTRQLQAALSEDREMEREERNLEEQIKTLKKTREKRIEDMETKNRNMKKEIESFRQQNEALREQGSKLKDTVEQRKKIVKMQGNIEAEELDPKDDDQPNLTDSKKHAKAKASPEKNQKDNPGYKKAMQIAHNRSLFDKAKKLAQEFELLMQELKKLKARTFTEIPPKANNLV